MYDPDSMIGPRDGREEVQARLFQLDKNVRYQLREISRLEQSLEVQFALLAETELLRDEWRSFADRLGVEQPEQPKT